jgi:hypothetical protein
MSMREAGCAADSARRTPRRSARRGTAVGAEKRIVGQAKLKSWIAAVRKVKRGERLDDPVAAARDVVQVDDVDAKDRTARRRSRPRLAVRARTEGAHAPVRPVRFDLPARADRDREMVTPAARDASISERAWCSVPPPPWPWITCSTPGDGEVTR